MYKKSILTTVIASAMMTACGGQSDIITDQASVVLTGIFTDSAVAGISYSTASQQGVTSSEGAYQYVEGEMVTFSLAGLELPEVAAKQVITPMDYNAIADLSQLLQSLDWDGDVNNGIDIRSEVLAALNVSEMVLQSENFDQVLEQEIARLQELLANTDMQYVDGTSALEHLDENPVLAATGGVYGAATLDDNILTLVASEDASDLSYALEVAGFNNINTAFDYRTLVVIEGDVLDREATAARIDAATLLAQPTLTNQEAVAPLAIFFGDVPAYANFTSILRLTDIGQLDLDFLNSEFEAVKAAALAAEIYILPSTDSTVIKEPELFNQALKNLGWDIYTGVNYIALIEESTRESTAESFINDAFNSIAEKNEIITTAAKEIEIYGTYSNVEYLDFVIISEDELDLLATESAFAGLNTLFSFYEDYALTGRSPSTFEVISSLNSLGIITDINQEGQDYGILIFKQINLVGINAEQLQAMVTAVKRLSAFRMVQDFIADGYEAYLDRVTYLGLSAETLSVYNEPQALIDLLKAAQFDLPAETLNGSIADYSNDILNRRNVELENDHNIRWKLTGGTYSLDPDNFLDVAATQLALQERMTSGVASVRVNRQLSYANYDNAVIKNDGSVFMWDQGIKKSFNTDKNASPVTEIFASNTFHLAMRADGTAFSFTLDGGVRELVLLSGGSQQVVMTRSGIVVLRNDGKIVEITRSTSGLVPFTTDFSSKAVAIFSTSNQYSAIRDDGTVYFWGSGVVQADTTEDSQTLDVNMLEIEVPGRNGADDSETMLSITTTEGAFAGLMKNGRVIVWGDHSDMNGSEFSSAAARAVNDMSDDEFKPVVSITGNTRAFAALRDDGSIVAWGANKFGGILAKDQFVIPDAQKNTYDKNNDGVVDEDTASYNCYLYTSDCVYDSELGMSVPKYLTDSRYRTYVDETLIDENNRQLLNTSGGKYVSIIANENSFTAFREDGTNLGWGFIYNREGLDQLSGRLSEVKRFIANKDYQTYAAIMTDGSTLSWGGRSFHSDYPERYTEFADANLNDIKSVYIGGRRPNFAIRNDGSLASWGSTLTSTKVLLAETGDNKEVQPLDLNYFDGSEPKKSVVELMHSDIYTSYAVRNSVPNVYRTSWIALLGDKSVAMIGSFDIGRYYLNHTERHLATINNGQDYQLLDTDQDGITNVDELIAGTSPASTDSDQDGITDSVEIENQLDPRTAFTKVEDIFLQDTFAQGINGPLVWKNILVD